MSFRKLTPAKLIVRELQSALDSAGFPLKKRTSNHKEILANIEGDHLLTTDFLEIDQSIESRAKTLGVWWKATSDKLFFDPPDLATEISRTKRQVLSQIAKLFDPTRWLAPFVVCAKIIMQEICIQDQVGTINFQLGCAKGGTAFSRAIRS